jgi:hypothetical protein
MKNKKLENSKNTTDKKTKTSESPKRLLIPLSLSPEEALKRVKEYFGIGEQ